MGKHNEDKLVALKLWAKEVSKKSLFCSIQRNEYLRIIDRSIVYRVDNEVKAAISLIKRSYISDYKKIHIYALHRIVATRVSGLSIFHLLSIICSDRKDTYSSTTSNDKAFPIYKNMGFLEKDPSQYLHTYLINPIYLPLFIINLPFSLLYQLFFILLKKLPFSRSKIHNKYKTALAKHIHLRSANNNVSTNSISLDWDCKILKRFIDYMQKYSRLIFHNPQSNNIDDFSLLIIVKFNFLYRALFVSDSTYFNRDAEYVLRKSQLILLRNSFLFAAPRVVIPSNIQKAPLKNGHFIYLKANKYRHLVINDNGLFEKMSDQDTRSLFHGDSFL